MLVVLRLQEATYSTKSMVVYNGTKIQEAIMVPMAMMVQNNDGR